MTDDIQHGDQETLLSHISGYKWKKEEDRYEVLVPFNKLGELKKILPSVMKDGHKKDIDIVAEEVPVMGKRTESWNRVSVKAYSIDIKKLQAASSKALSRDIERS
ncbi:MAG: hypothetical protein AABY33_06350 [Pseudomonadota bacterium]